MDSKPPLKYQTWFLKVSIHCDGCRRKVKKVLQSIDGVFTTIIDQQQQKVTVTGSVTVETLLSKLLRAGKHAEIWPENISVKENKNKSNTHKLENDNHSYAEKTTQNCNKVMSKSSNIKPGQKSPEKSPAGDRESPQEHKGCQSGGGGGSAKKKKKGQGDVSVNHGSAGAPAPADTGFGFQNQGLDFGREMGKMNLIPTRQKQEKSLYTETSCPPPMVYAGAYYNIMCAGLDQEYGCQIQSRPLVSFEIFSDENVNGCSIM
ncbi:heavy metal-associated isoprenylated plant protein 35-like [Arachis stenosperma]|uniref:heavy metal-associated isoprenylated plant protein 35-like n=1 Tax=Arachis stenosperma TaxID=217475 RepID=UPI0025AD8AD3|nr:heavy metal-associated isoprenylated plant protein 35-like [Arachis stenosperma]